VIAFRLAHAGAQGMWGVDADLTAFAKIIGGGFPVGATGGRREVMAVFDPTHGKPALPAGGTFSANPVTMRAGLAAMNLLDDAAFAHLANLGEAVRQGIDEAFRSQDIEGRTTGLGSLLRVHMTDKPVRDYRSAHLDAVGQKRLAAFVAAMLDRGILMASTGLMALSTVMQQDEVEAIVMAATDSIRASATS
jgi:glutamate-1-semialdehyde 2,1-aminomutase